MGKMYTLHSDESINDHMSESIAMLNQLAESVGIGYYRNSTTIHGISTDSVRFIIEHIRDSIQMLDELCDELEEGKDEIRHEYEEKVIQFFNRFMNADLNDETNYRLGECVRHIHEIENHYMKEIQTLTEDCKRFRDLAISRNKELEEERKRSNQVENFNLELAKTLLRDKIGQINSLKSDKTKLESTISDLQDRLKRKESEIEQLSVMAQLDEIKRIRKELDCAYGVIKDRNQIIRNLRDKINNPNNSSNFCGNCAYCHSHPDDTFTCEWRPDCVDPDDSSCKRFKPNYATSKKYGMKPEFPCCEHCSHEDCDDCTLCPF